jgi:hypothetical protein
MKPSSEAMAKEEERKRMGRSFFMRIIKALPLWPVNQ